ncbi:MAG: helix-turn-helix transcriptional regulator [Roseburia sp.]|nr:helix-turn-helix transcriptional regulator [Roseburia sp.]
MADNLLGAYLRTLRKQNGYSQEFVASKLNIIRQTYSHYETGRIVPPIDSLYHLAKLYQISADAFLELAVKNEEADSEYETVSLSYSSGGPSHREVSLEEENELLRCYRLLDDRDRADILEFMRIKCRRGSRPGAREKGLC